LRLSAMGTSQLALSMIRVYLTVVVVVPFSPMTEVLRFKFLPLIHDPSSFINSQNANI
jgi:hypothetical protein